MPKLGVRGKWFISLGLIFSLMMGWAPMGLADEAKKEEAPAPAEDRPTDHLEHQTPCSVAPLIHRSCTLSCLLLRSCPANSAAQTAQAQRS